MRFLAEKGHTFFASKRQTSKENMFMSSVKKSCICAFCIALCTVLPMAFHAVALGSVFSPMHLPVLLCGLLCGWPYGAFCGIAGPVIASLITGMPPTPQLICMAPELCAYGLFTGLLLKGLHTGRLYGDLYLALIPAMLLGRVVGGVARALLYFSIAQAYSVSLWAAAYVVETLPGAILQLILLPVLVLVLMKAGLIPQRYGHRASLA